MRKIPDETGKRFGRWLVIAMHPERRRGGHVFWLCRCDCGTEGIVRGDSLRGGGSNSCGCLRRERCRKRLVKQATKHGLTGTRAFQCWANMLQRCLNPGHPRYPDYGGRGISVRDDWLNFENFYADMLDPPPGLSIDRIDNDGNYEPGNCRWTTPAVQVANRRPRRRR